MLGTRGENILKNKLEFNSYLDYDLFVNSSRNKRGVAILINKKLNAAVLDIIKCPNEDFLLLKVKIKNSVLLVGSIYCDVYSKQPNFLPTLKDCITATLTEHYLIGGDFNCITNPHRITNTNISNIETQNVKQIPNPQNSRLFCDMIN